MSRFALIFVVVILAWSCSVSRTAGTEIEGRRGNIISFKELTDQNLSGRDFIISKAEVTLNSDEYRGKFFAIIKFKYPFDWLISIRDFTGIEAARVYISQDTILINERIHRKLYYGNSIGLERKFGLNSCFLPLILGDYLGTGEDSMKINNCRNGKSVVSTVHENKSIDYTIDCKYGKVIQTRIESSGEYGEIFFSKFKTERMINYPSVIEMKSGKLKMSVKIPKGKIDFTTIDSLLFVPGKGYEKLLLR